mmetsp:Transcript_9028/g.8054  ORF Transcript_9028/g.8054 Transcript_9028/m.8054 type:complete len:225 (+) Transcript_9028:52-726(+)
MAGNVRRTWDRDFYAAKAKERAEKGDDYDKIDTNIKNKKITQREEFKPADDDALGPIGSDRAYLNPRQSKLDLESKVGKVEIIKSGEANTSHGPGYWCEVCQCLLKDSIGYLDHINGKKHQRALGFSMRVERVGADRVKDKIESLKRKAKELKEGNINTTSVVDDYESKIAARLLQEEIEKRRRKEEQLAKKKEKDVKELEDLEVIDPNIAELMGFNGFGTSKR